VSPLKKKGREVVFYMLMDCSSLLLSPGAFLGLRTINFQKGNVGRGVNILIKNRALNFSKNHRSYEFSFEQVPHRDPDSLAPIGIEPFLNKCFQPIDKGFREIN
jgi:hypothetical protein